MPPKRYLYKYHGLTIDSNIHLPELTLGEGENKIDVTISLGMVPEKLYGDNIIKRKIASLNKEIALFDLPGIGRFLVDKGRSIICAPEEHVDTLPFRHFLLGLVFNACLHQRGLLPLHASAIVVDDSGIAFAGPSGIGKSTTAVALALKGYPLLSDDTIVVQFKDKLPYISASLPRVKLWDDALINIGSSKLEEGTYLKGYSHSNQKRKKYGIQVENEYFKGVVPLKLIYRLSVNPDNSTFNIYDRSPTEGVSILRESVSKKDVLDTMNVPSRSFHQFANISKNVRIKEIVRPGKKQHVNEFIEFLVNDIEKSIRELPDDHMH